MKIGSRANAESSLLQVVFSSSSIICVHHVYTKAGDSTWSTCCRGSPGKCSGKPPPAFEERAAGSGNLSGRYPARAENVGERNETSVFLWSIAFCCCFFRMGRGGSRGIVGMVSFIFLFGGVDLGRILRCRDQFQKGQGANKVRIKIRGDRGVHRLIPWDMRITPSREGVGEINI